MTAPTNSAPLPVVASVIWHLKQHPDVPLVQSARMRKTIGGLPSDLDAVTVPLALFDDEEFMTAVDRREWDSARKSSNHRGLSSWLTAIAAELRARAGVPETNFGNVGGADA
jgi:hypothetical protein